MLLLLLLLQHLLTVADAIIAIFLILDPVTLQNLDPVTSVNRIIAGKVAVGVPPADFVATMIGDALEVAHSTAVCDPFTWSAPVTAPASTNQCTWETCLL